MRHYVQQGYTETNRTVFHQELREGGSGAFYLEGQGPVTLQGEPILGHLLFAHGAGAGQDSAFMRQFATSLARQGVQVLTLDFAYMQQMHESRRRRPPPKIDKLVDELAQWYHFIEKLVPSPIWVGGKSMGGRVASMLAAQQLVAGVIVTGYPFHPARAPEKRRLAHWPQVMCPALIAQGERDPLGSRQEVEGYTLPANVNIEWLTDGDHDFKPRRSTGLSQQILIDEAALLAASFVRARKTACGE
ncbi:alpha/beta fold hydrolase [Halomonas llamarensis]|uniref:Alpha/beta fold hydrolase n=1 Tax=Halomonas llamarensis TaxID=2945104 RepID=A0ABT0SKW6_9GAMM|nr:alpha/beta fold hydrolase [Halomonas llamarensis]MCL7928442.1 alpha/beta fold hydrolase [Halomonas llamarensis]